MDVVAVVSLLNVLDALGALLISSIVVVEVVRGFVVEAAVVRGGQSSATRSLVVLLFIFKVIPLILQVLMARGSGHPLSNAYQNDPRSLTSLKAQQSIGLPARQLKAISLASYFSSSLQCGDAASIKN